ncbi:hypothetical protein BU26DRAFT_169061 [Trematosphaeria pertusa]|uniref:Uncharacterized protein n=1 Tax=Trematosphaeria pertusa TaxID=390896 RepID=A0A6A6HVC8_9PLEO|nr:uncharacterized protein BU26DRAFT_169061 [Trematosphaeria pertusa]KAF2241712.1 hypothetical protein BU26DRAFT_169061 [Trematosphaeria pertusa]
MDSTRSCNCLKGRRASRARACRRKWLAKPFRGSGPFLRRYWKGPSICGYERDISWRSWLCVSDAASCSGACCTETPNMRSSRMLIRTSLSSRYTLFALRPGRIFPPQQMRNTSACLRHSLPFISLTCSP